ncbi:MAG: site-2 protease family protein [Clostridia bacterium]|nr:site-2 protease family protein [Clostridia bacterium]
MFLVFPRIRLRISVFAIPSLIIMLLIEGVLPFSILIFSALIHEIGHLAAMRLLGYRARRVDVLPMGALIVCPEGISYLHETVIALSGPFASILTSCAAFCVYAISKDDAVFFVAFINLLLGAFNLMPIEKLDGGKALYCFLSYKNKEDRRRITSAASYVAKLVIFILVTVALISSGGNLGAIVLSLALLMQT